MTKILLLLALTGCSTIQNHPFVTSAAGNSALVIGAGACALECQGVPRAVSEGILIGELALASMLTLIAVEAIASYTSERH